MSDSSRSTRSLRVALIAYALASAALGIAGVVTAVALYERSGSAGWATIGAVARVAPFVLLSSFAGVMASRQSARTLLVVASCGVGAGSIGLAVLAPSGPLASVAVLGFAAHAAWTVGYPSMASMVPRLVPTHSLASANGYLSTVESLAWFAGPGLGGLLIAAFGLRAAAAAGVVLAVVAVLTWSRVPAVAGPAPTSDGVLAAIRAGAGELRAPALRGVVALQLAGNAVYGALSVLLVIAATDRLGFGEGGYGLLTAATAIGSLAALGVVRRLGRTRRPAVPLAASVLASGLPIALLALVEAPTAAIVLVAVGGLGTVLVDVLVLTVLQRELPAASLPPVLGLLDSVAIGTIALGSVAAGPLVAVLGLERALVVVGAVVPALAVLVLPAARFRWTEPVPLLGAGQLVAAVPMLVAARPSGSSRIVPTFDPSMPLEDALVPATTNTGETTEPDDAGTAASNGHGSDHDRSVESAPGIDPARVDDAPTEAAATSHAAPGGDGGPIVSPTAVVEGAASETAAEMVVDEHAGPPTSREPSVGAPVAVDEVAPPAEVPSVMVASMEHGAGAVRSPGGAMEAPSATTDASVSRAEVPVPSAPAEPAALADPFDDAVVASVVVDPVAAAGGVSDPFDDGVAASAVVDPVAAAGGVSDPFHESMGGPAVSSVPASELGDPPTDDIAGDAVDDPTDGLADEPIEVVDDLGDEPIEDVSVLVEPDTDANTDADSLEPAEDLIDPWSVPDQVVPDLGEDETGFLPEDADVGSDGLDGDLADGLDNGLDDDPDDDVGAG